jgi:hypothetical protein
MVVNKAMGDVGSVAQRLGWVVDDDGGGGEGRGAWEWCLTTFGSLATAGRVGMTHSGSIGGETVPNYLPRQRTPNS